MVNSKLDNQSDWKKNIMNGKGKEIAREFFLTFETQEKVSKKLYPNRKKAGKGKGKRENKVHYVEPIINIRCKEWEKYGFFEKSKPIPFEDKWGRTQNRYHKIMNLEPIYEFCKKRGIEFEEEEKKFLNDILLSEYTRKEILEEYPDEDIINATIKYYVKKTIMKYFFYLRDVRENEKKYKKQYEKAKKLNNPRGSFEKELKKTLKITTDFDVIKVIAGELPLWNPSAEIFYSSNFLFRRYLRYLENKGDFIPTLDNKMLSTLQISPEKAPIEMVKKVGRPDRSSYHLDHFNGTLLYTSLYNLFLIKKESYRI